MGSIIKKCIVFFSMVCVALILFGEGPAAAAESDCAVVAANFLRYVQSDKEILACEIVEAHELDPAAPGVAVACLVRLKGGGYLLIAASQELTPVKAYSLTHDFETLPPAYRRYLLLEMEYHTRALMARLPERERGAANPRA